VLAAVPEPRAELWRRIGHRLRWGIWGGRCRSDKHTAMQRCESTRHVLVLSVVWALHLPVCSLWW